jgi:GT2 family glycosyltransferase/glycosyltransferase involved in cell wall biosynthesis
VNSVDLDFCPMASVKDKPIRFKSKETLSKVDVVIVNYNTKELLYKCLGTLLPRGENANLNVFLVDNASSDNSVKMLKEEFPQVALIQNVRNVGFAAAVNQAILESNSKYILLLNPDAAMTPESIEDMVNLMEAHPPIAAIGPKIVDENGKVAVSAFIRPPSLWTTLSNFLSIEALIKKTFPLKDFPGKYSLSHIEAETPREVSHLLGACLLLRREAFQDAGQLDERFFVFREETDLCLRLGKLGWKIWYYPKAQVLHLCGSSVKQLGIRGKRVSLQSDMVFFCKYSGIGKVAAIFSIRILEEIVKSVPWILGIFVLPFSSYSYLKLKNHFQWIQALSESLSILSGRNNIYFYRTLDSELDKRGTVFGQKSKIRVGIDGFYFDKENVGMGVYVRELFKAINRIDNSECEIMCICPSKKINNRYLGGKICNIINEIMWYFKELPSRAKLMRLDILHMPANLISSGVKCSQVLTIHDLNCRRPSAYGFVRKILYSGWIALGIRYSTAIIADSNAVKADIIKQFKVDEDKVKVIHLGISPEYYPKSKQFRWEEFKPYVFWVSKIDVLKNVPRLIEAFSIISCDNRFQDLHLLVAGEDGRDSPRVRRMIKQLRLEHKVHLLGRVSREELSTLFKNAEIFVYPSLSEGFGFPPLEANAAGVPVLASSTSSLPEVLGKAAYYFDPNDVRQIAISIEKVLLDKPLREVLISSGKVNSLRYSWFRTALQTMQVYQEIGKN